MSGFLQYIKWVSLVAAYFSPSVGFRVLPSFFCQSVLGHIVSAFNPRSQISLGKPSVDWFTDSQHGWTLRKVNRVLHCFTLPRTRPLSWICGDLQMLSPRSKEQCQRTCEKTCRNLRSVLLQGYVFVCISITLDKKCTRRTQDLLLNEVTFKLTSWSHNLYKNWLSQTILNQLRFFFLWLFSGGWGWGGQRNRWMDSYSYDPTRCICLKQFVNCTNLHH